MMAHKLFEHRNILYYIYHNQLNIYTDIYVTDLQLVHHWKGQISKPPIQIDQKNFLSESGRLEKTNKTKATNIVHMHHTAAACVRF
jgi:hypothetical protein